MSPRDRATARFSPVGTIRPGLSTTISRRVTHLQVAENLAGAVRRSAVGDDHFDPVLRVVLGQDGVDQIGDEPGFIANRYHDAHEGAESMLRHHAVGASRRPGCESAAHVPHGVDNGIDLIVGRIEEKSGRLTRRVHSADATGRSAGRQPNVCS